MARIQRTHHPIFAGSLESAACHVVDHAASAEPPAQHEPVQHPEPSSNSIAQVQDWLCCKSFSDAASACSSVTAQVTEISKVSLLLETWHCIPLSAKEHFRTGQLVTASNLMSTHDNLRVSGICITR